MTEICKYETTETVLYTNNVMCSVMATVLEFQSVPTSISNLNNRTIRYNLMIGEINKPIYTVRLLTLKLKIQQNLGNQATDISECA